MQLHSNRRNVGQPNKNPLNFEQVYLNTCYASSVNDSETNQFVRIPPPTYGFATPQPGSMSDLGEGTTFDHSNKPKNNENMVPMKAKIGMGQG